VFFNTTPHIVTLLLGITTAMEEKNSQQKNMDATAIDNVKASLMGPLAGLGDSFFWGTLRLIATGIGTSLALKGNISGRSCFCWCLTCRTFWCAGALPAGATCWAPGSCSGSRRAE
jgi:fructoselysine and glucoselysine-specific PTS system IID component